MQLALRLYYPIDADLIAIRLYEKRRFTSLVRDNVTRLLDSSTHTLSDQDIYRVPKDIKKFIRMPSTPVKVNLNLREGRDDIIIDYLNQIDSSKRCDTVKAIFRMSFDIYPDDYFPVNILLNVKKTRTVIPTVSPKPKVSKTKIRSDSKNSKKKEKEGKIPLKETIPLQPEVKQEEIPIEHPISNEVKENIQKIADKTEYIRHIENENIETKTTQSSQPVPESGTSKIQDDSNKTDTDKDGAAYDLFFKLLGY